MQLHYDKTTDAIYLQLDDQSVVDSEEVRPGIVFDYDAEGNVVAIEVLRSMMRRSSETGTQGLDNDHMVRARTADSLANDLRSLRDRLHASGVVPMTVEQFDRELAELRGE